MLQGGYLSVLQAQNRDEFREEVVRFTRSLGFETVTAMAVVDHGIARSDFVVVDNAPQAFLGAYHNSRFGYQTGIAMALHLPEGRHFLLGVDRDRALPNDRGELTRVVADLQLFAVHALDAAMRVLVPTDSPQDLPSLTPRELEALRWTMDGKTAWEVGSILGVTERTAVLHLNNAMHKLGCVNKHQAVLKALRLGMLR
jgi:DNA-binding CsgD family transcriptional regulator